MVGGHARLVWVTVLPRPLCGPPQAPFRPRHPAHDPPSELDRRRRGPGRAVHHAQVRGGRAPGFPGPFFVPSPARPDTHPSRFPLPGTPTPARPLAILSFLPPGTPSFVLPSLCSFCSRYFSRHHLPLFDEEKECSGLARSFLEHLLLYRGSFLRLVSWLDMFFAAPQTISRDILLLASGERRCCVGLSGRGYYSESSVSSSDSPPRTRFLSVLAESASSLSSGFGEEEECSGFVRLCAPISGASLLYFGWFSPFRCIGSVSCRAETC